MQALILAAGLGSRMRPLTNSVAKPMLLLAGRPLIEYTFDALPDEVDEVIIVIGYLGDQIKTHLGDEHRGRRIKYVTQQNLEGTAKALLEARPLIHGRFLVLMADDLYAKEDIERCLTHEQAMLVYRQERESPGGEVVLDEKGNLSDVVEKKVIPIGALVATNVYVLAPIFFNYEAVRLTDRANEWGLPQTVACMAKDERVTIVEGTRWIKITAPGDLKIAEHALAK